MKLKCLIVSIILLLGFVLPVGAVSKYVYDDADFLSAEEEAQLEEMAREISNDKGVTMLVALKNSNYYEGDWFLSEEGIYDSNIVLLIITRESGIYYYDIYTYGDAYSEISDAEIDRILDNEDVYNGIKSGNLYDGLSAYLRAADKAYSGLLWASVSSTLTTGLFIFVIVMSISTISIICSYKKKQKSTNYPLERYTRLNLTEKNDIFLGSTVSKVRISSSSSGGGGGRSHGGGGGHRGGR